MTLIIRLFRRGKPSQPVFVIGLADKHKPSMIKEKLGLVNRRTDINNFIYVTLNYKRCFYWIDRGAILSKPVKKLVYGNVKCFAA